MIKVTNKIEFGHCPLCQGKEIKILFTGKPPFPKFNLVQCERCGLTRTARLPQEEFFDKHHLDHYYGRDVHKFLPVFQKIRNRMMRLRVKHYASLLPETTQKPKVLDIGCAEGRLLSALIDYGYECWGIEHPAYPAGRFLNPGRIKYLIGDLQSFHFNEGMFDLIFLWHTLEHMEDLQPIMDRVSHLLSPEGAVIIAVPNFSSTEAKVFRQSWFHLDLPWHRFHFNDRSLDYLVKKHQFKIVDKSTFCLEQGPFGLIQSVLNTAGCKRNHVYEALKGNRAYSRALPLFIQFVIGFILFLPALLVSIVTSLCKKGPVVKLILQKDQ